MSLILIADDNPHAQRMGRQILHQEGHTVETVSNGDDAVAYLGENLPNLVMLDTRMPGPNGYEVCELIKGSDNLSAVKVVLLAGPLEPFDPGQAERVGSDAVLHKPLDAYSLIETVHSLIGKPAAQQVEEDRIPTEEEFLEATQGKAEQLAAASAEAAATAEPASKEKASAESPQPETPDAPTASGPFNGADAEALDELVQLALDDPSRAPALDAETVRTSVVEVLEASIPALAETITKRILARHEAMAPAKK